MGSSILLLLACVDSISGQDQDSLHRAGQIDSLFVLCNGQVDLRDFVQAKSYADSAIRLALTSFGSESLLYGYALFYLGRVYEFSSQYTLAEQNYLASMSVISGAIGTETFEYTKSLCNLANTYQRMGQYARAKPYYLECLDIRKRILGADHEEYGAASNNIGVMYVNLGDYPNALKCCRESAEIRRRKYGETSRYYAASLNNIAVLQMETGQFDDAESSYLRSLEILIDVLGPRNAEVAQGYHNLGNMYLRLGRYSTAESRYLQALDIRLDSMVCSRSELAVTILCLGNLYTLMGRYRDAESMYQDALEIQETTIGRVHPEYAATLSGLGDLYADHGNWAQAIEKLMESVRVLEISQGPDHPDIAHPLMGLSAAYMGMGRHEEAMQCYERSAVIRSKAFGKQDKLYINCLIGMGSLAILEEELDRARRFYSEALASLNMHDADKFPISRASCLTGMATVQIRQDSLVQALSNLQGARSIFQSSIGPFCNELVPVLELLADVYDRKGNARQSVEMLDEIFSIYKDAFSKGISYLSANELEVFAGKIDRSLDVVLFRLMKQADQGEAHPDPLLSGLAYDLLLFRKEYILNAQATLHSTLSQDSSGRVDFERLAGYRRQLAAEYAKPTNERTNLEVLESAADNLEKKLVRYASEFSKAQSPGTWHDVQQKLNEGDVAMEFFRSKFRDSTWYSVLLCRADDDAPVYQRVCLAGEIDILIREKYTRRGISTVYGSAHSESHELNHLIWQPLEPWLTNTERMILAPYGALNQVNFPLIPVNDGKVLMDDYEFVTVGSTRQLLEEDFGLKKETATAWITGGVKYDCESDWTAESDYVFRSIEPDSMDMTFAGYRSSVLQYLPHSLVESEQIADLLMDHQFTVHLDTGMVATETSFRQLSRDVPSARVIHLATHGYFFPDPKEGDQSGQDNNAYRSASNPLIRSGLLMACSAPAWLAGSFQGDGDDGVLTAYEIAQMDLRNTELVVLSACETALGDIVGSEGVYGLQRAFRIAGVKNLIMTLWKVNDEVSMQFFTRFYTYWIQDQMTLSQAFYTAQKDLRHQYPDSPYLWAGFVLLQ